MGSFATMYGLTRKMVAGNITIGLSNHQFLLLSEAFSYFEEHPGIHAIEAIYCGSVCNNIKRKPVTSQESIRNMSLGAGINLGRVNMNIPILYKDYFDDLR